VPKGLPTNLDRVIAELRAELETINDAILALERLGVDHNRTGAGSSKLRLADKTKDTRTSTAAGNPS
jgi:hypothetical protein